MTDKEVLVQIALGTFNTNINGLRRIVKTTRSPRVLTAVAKIFVDNIECDNDGVHRGLFDNEYKMFEYKMFEHEVGLIVTGFKNNQYTPKLVKDYIILSMQIKIIEEDAKDITWCHDTSIPVEDLKEQLQVIHNQLFQSNKPIHKLSSSRLRRLCTTFLRRLSN